MYFPVRSAGEVTFESFIIPDGRLSVKVYGATISDNDELKWKKMATVETDDNAFSTSNENSKLLLDINIIKVISRVPPEYKERIRYYHVIPTSSSSSTSKRRVSIILYEDRDSCSNNILLRMWLRRSSQESSLTEDLVNTFKERRPWKHVRSRDSEQNLELYREAEAEHRRRAERSERIRATRSKAIRGGGNRRARQHRVAAKTTTETMATINEDSTMGTVDVATFEVEEEEEPVAENDTVIDYASGATSANASVAFYHQSEYDDYDEASTLLNEEEIEVLPDAFPFDVRRNKKIIYRRPEVSGDELRGGTKVEGTWRLYGATLPHAEDQDNFMSSRHFHTITISSDKTFVESTVSEGSVALNFDFNILLVKGRFANDETEVEQLFRLPKSDVILSSDYVTLHNDATFGTIDIPISVQTRHVERATSDNYVKFFAKRMDAFELQPQSKMKKTKKMLKKGAVIALHVGVRTGLKFLVGPLPIDDFILETASIISSNVGKFISEAGKSEALAMFFMSEVNNYVAGKVGDGAVADTIHAKGVKGLATRNKKVPDAPVLFPITIPLNSHYLDVRFTLPN